MKQRRAGLAKNAASRAKRAPRKSSKRTPRVAAESGSEVTRPEVSASGAPATASILTGGDVDADWMRAESSGEEAVGGSVATPDQDVVDELGRALGVEQEADAEIQTSEQILRERDRQRWRLEREAGRDETEEEADRIDE